MIRLVGTTQNYDWGNLADKSKVASLASANPGFVIKADSPYAEVHVVSHRSPDLTRLFFL